MVETRQVRPAVMSRPSALLVPGDTCWRRDRAERLAFLIDIQAYYAAVMAAMRAARQSIFILGWAFDPRSKLAPVKSDDGEGPDEIGRFLLRLVSARPDLDVRLLVWKSALAISATQGFFPHRARRWFRNTPVRLRLDDQVPFGGCHHQKVVVVDDAVAFCGSTDFSVDRWDTVRHLDNDTRRVMPGAVVHGPRHEVMTMVDGAPAAAFGELFRTRWRASGGDTRPKRPIPDDQDAWPVHVKPALLRVDVAISRTRPALRGRKVQTEIRQLHLATIASAKHLIYLENQYLASPVIAEALAARLAERNGPEVVLVTTGQAPSWFDRLTMDRTRAVLLERLMAADRHRRFLAVSPKSPGGARVIVHSKVGIFDDRIAQVGSANLNNRSGGFDTECDLTVEAINAAQRRGIAELRDELVGHFLGVSGKRVAEAKARLGGLIPAIAELNGENRLVGLAFKAPGALGHWMATHSVGDPYEVSDSWRLDRRAKRLALARTALGETAASPFKGALLEAGAASGRKEAGGQLAANSKSITKGT